MARRRAQVGRSVERSRTVPERPVAPAPSWPPWAVLRRSSRSPWSRTCRRSRRLHLGRRRLRHRQRDAALAARPAAHLARAGRRAAVLPAHLHELSGSSHQLWGSAPPATTGQRAPARASNAVLVWRVLRRLARPGRLARGRDLRAPSRARRVGGVDHRAQERALRRVLPRRPRWRICAGRWPLAGARRRGAAGSTRVALGLFAARCSAKTVTCTLPVVARCSSLWWKRGRAASGRTSVPLAPFVRARRRRRRWSRSGWSGRTSARGARRGTCRSRERVLIAGRALWFYARDARSGRRP